MKKETERQLDAAYHHIQNYLDEAMEERWQSLQLLIDEKGDKK